MTDKSKPTEAEIRKRAHEIWEREGRPQVRDEEHWHKAEDGTCRGGPRANEGEGSRARRWPSTAARQSSPKAAT